MLSSTGALRRVTMRKVNGKLGFNIVGGSSDYFGGTFVSQVPIDSAAESAGLCQGDRILAVGERGVLTLTHAEVTDICVRTPDEVTLTILSSSSKEDWAALKQEVKMRLEASGPISHFTSLRPVELPLGKDSGNFTVGDTIMISLQCEDLGVTFCGGPESIFGALFVETSTSLPPSSDEDSNLIVGDRILEIQVDCFGPLLCPYISLFVYLTWPRLRVLAFLALDCCLLSPA